MSVLGMLKSGTLDTAGSTVSSVPSTVAAFQSIAAEVLSPKSCSYFGSTADLVSKLHFHRGALNEETLRALGDTSQNHRWELQEGKTDRKEELRNAYNRIVESIMNEVFHDPRWSQLGIEPITPIVHMEGGFSWLIPVLYKGVERVIAVPKFQDDASSMIKRYGIRKVGIGALENTWFNAPKVHLVLKDPLPACIMDRLEGINCWPITFDASGGPRADLEGAASSREVFKFLGRAARIIANVSGEGFGDLDVSKPSPVGTYNTLQAYAYNRIGLIEDVLIKGSRNYFEGRSYGREDVRRVIEFVRQDVKRECQPTLVHGDLSPWNILYRKNNQPWSVTDWDDTRLSIPEEQMGVCLVGMRGYYHKPWIEALAEGYGLVDPRNVQTFLGRSGAFGAALMSLHYSAIAIQSDKNALAEEGLNASAPLVRLFKEWKEA